MIALYHGGPNGASLRLLIALEELGLDYEAHAASTATGKNLPSSHRAGALEGGVPLLVDGGLSMSDSAIALLYLAEAYPAKELFPDDPVQRYRAQASIDMLDAALLDSINLLGWHATVPKEQRAAYMAALENDPDRPRLAGWSAVWRAAEADQLARAREKALDGLGQIEVSLGNAPWLTGARYGVADISAFALTRLAPSLFDEQPIAARFRRFVEWRQRIAERESVRRVLTRAGTSGPDYAPPR